MQGRNQIPPPMRELPLFTPPRVLSSTTPRYVGNVACLAQQAYDKTFVAWRGSLRIKVRLQRLTYISSVIAKLMSFTEHLVTYTRDWETLLWYVISLVLDIS